MADKNDQPVEQPTEEEVPQQAENKQDVETPVEPTQTPETEEAPEVAEPEPEETAEDEPELTPRQQERVEEAKAKGMDSVRLEKLIANMTRPRQPAPQVDALDYSQLDADQEVVSALESDRRAYGEQLYNAGLAQAKALEFRTMLEIDSPKVEAKYPQLDKSSDQFDAASANDINLLYLQLVGYDPQTKQVVNDNLRYSDFVDAFMTTAETLAGQKAKTSSRNIAKQASQTGIRPSGQATKLNLNKSPQDMSDDELAAFLSKGGVKTQ